MEISLGLMKSRLLALEKLQRHPNDTLGQARRLIGQINTPFREKLLPRRH
jgi:hypothetical protein